MNESERIEALETKVTELAALCEKLQEDKASRSDLEVVEQSAVELTEEIEEIDQKTMNAFETWEKHFGIAFQRMQNGLMALGVATVKDDSHNPGLLAVLKHRVDKMWDQFGNGGVAIPKGLGRGG